MRRSVGSLVGRIRGGRLWNQLAQKPARRYLEQQLTIFVVDVIGELFFQLFADSCDDFLEALFMITLAYVLTAGSQGTDGLQEVS